MSDAMVRQNSRAVAVVVPGCAKCAQCLTDGTATLSLVVSCVFFALDWVCKALKKIRMIPGVDELREKLLRARTLLKLAAKEMHRIYLGKPQQSSRAAERQINRAVAQQRRRATAKKQGIEKSAVAKIPTPKQTRKWARAFGDAKRALEFADNALFCAERILNDLRQNRKIVVPLASGDRMLADVSERTNPALLPDVKLKDWQRDVMDARLVILQEVKKLAVKSLSNAADKFISKIKSGELSESGLTITLMAANSKSGSSRVITARTILRWLKEQKEGGDLALAPKSPDKEKIPDWASSFLNFYRLPSKPSIQQVLEMMGERAPSYAQAIRFLKQFSRKDAQRGRMTGSELRQVSKYILRDKSKLLPLDIACGDGHSYKAKVAHPAHGKPFIPTVVPIIDVATRVCLGWSAGLSESSHVVADAIRHAVTVDDKKPYGGAFAIFYCDIGSGNMSKLITSELTGLLARIGASLETSIPGNPQSRGVSERAHQSILVRSAKMLPTYCGKDMDSLAYRKITKIVERDIKERGTSDRLPSWKQFIDHLARAVDDYNNRPHGELPKILDLKLGVKRHMTPAESWQQFVANGWKPTSLSRDTVADLYRPQFRVKTRRAMVTLFNNVYFNEELEHYHGEDVIVGVDIHDPMSVQVRNLEGQLICEAKYFDNRRDFFPMSVVEQARRKRAEGRLQRLAEKVAEVNAEAKGVVDTSTIQYALPATEMHIPECAVKSSIQNTADSSQGSGE